jgi:hypothetical protein
MTRTSQIFLTVALVLGAAFAVPLSASAQPGYGSGQRITCSSDDGRRNWCDIGRARDVQLVHQISGSACIRDNTWGVDGRGLWVDRGCRAEFVFSGGGGGYEGGGGGYPGPQRPQGITCSSDDGRRNWCDIGRARDVRLSRQISGSPCIQDSTWGVDGRGLWVDRGCRAEFVFASGDGGFGGGGGGYPGPQQPQGITCSSDDGRRNWCDIGRARDVQLSRQISGSPCIQGSTWGIDGRGLWVDRGCRAEFVFGGGGGGYPGPQQPQVITCSSDNGRRNWCDVGNRRDIRFSRQISGSPCVQGDTWGIDRRGIWVDRGCRAEFFVR